MQHYRGMHSLDVAVLLKIIALGDGWLNKDLAVGLSISPSEISESLNRSRIAGLLDPAKRRFFEMPCWSLFVTAYPMFFPSNPARSYGVPQRHIQLLY